MCVYVFVRVSVTCATPVSLGTFTPPLLAEWRWSGSLWEGLTRAYPSSPPPVPICCRPWWMLLSGGCWAWSSGPSAPTGPVTTLISTVIEGNWMESAPLGQPGLRRCWWYLWFHCGGLHRWWNTLVSTWVIVCVNGASNNLKISCWSEKIATVFFVCCLVTKQAAG